MYEEKKSVNMDTALRVHGVMGVSLVWCEDAKGNPSYHLGETSPFHNNSTGYRFMCMPWGGPLIGVEKRRFPRQSDTQRATILGRLRPAEADLEHQDNQYTQ